MPKPKWLYSVKDVKRGKEAADADWDAKRAMRAARKHQRSRETPLGGVKPQRTPRAGTQTIEYETRRPTATRTAAGFLLGGPVGALIGFAARKKERKTARIE
jgi:hypothetical protein